MKAPVKRKNKQVITSQFGMRTLNGKKRMHRGVDLRSIRFAKGFGFVEQWGLQDIQATERCRVLRYGTDNSGNDYIVVEPLESDYVEIKYIHVELDGFVKKKGMILEAGDKIGKTQIKGTSKSHHLHFETWKDVDGKKSPVDPVEYFKAYDIDYKFK